MEYDFISDIKSNMDPKLHSKFDALMAACNVEGDYEMVYCSEADSNIISTVLNSALYTGAKSFTWLVGNGEYWCGSYGPGWFSIGIGSPLHSAICETFADLSVVGKPNGYDYDSRADISVVL